MEFMTLSGSTIAVVTLVADQVRPIAKDEIAHARQVAVAQRGGPQPNMVEARSPLRATSKNSSKRPS